MTRLCSVRLVRLWIAGSNRLPTTLNSENSIQRKRGSMNTLVSTNASERFSASRASLGYGEQEIIAESRKLREVLSQAEMVAATDCTVLVQGDTGTGKELIAGLVHNHSPRRQHAHIKLNCAAIPLGLLESELFGHERGAFTGAMAQRLGRFELADKGSLFLDEVGDIPLELQAKLLRVLQEHEFERLGSTYTRRANVRVVAATNQNLAGLVAEKLFRMDLYYRLNVFPIALPPLRQRPEDIPLLVAFFVDRYATGMGKRIRKIP